MVNRTVLYGAAVAVIGHAAHDAHEPPRDTDARRKATATVPRAPGSNHIEVDELQAAIAAGIEREARPSSISFDNSDAFPNPALRAWQPQPQLFGLNLALMLGNEG